NAITNTGVDVAAWVGSLGITDADANAVQGIAITGVDDTNGAWQFSIDGAATWQAIPANVVETNALLLGATANNRVRFVPATNYFGNSTFTFRAWDLTSGLLQPYGSDGGFAD